jgi:hypothetical protein
MGGGYILSEPVASDPLHLTWPWPRLVPHKRCFETPRGYGPRGRRAIGRLSETNVGYKSGLWLLPLHVATCRHLSAPSFTMAPKPRSAEPAMDAHADLEDKSSQYSSLDQPLHAIALVLEQMALVNARMDAHSTAITAHRQRDAKRDTPRHVQSTTPTHLPPPPSTIPTLWAPRPRPRTTLHCLPALRAPPT